jgi:hypothetical protein
LTKDDRTIQAYEGQWTGISNVGSTKGPVFLDTSAPKEEVTVKPIEEQGEWESRRLWDKVAKGIRTGNYDIAGQEKNRIEVGTPHLMKEKSFTDLHRTSSDSDAETRPPPGRRGSWCGSSTLTRTTSTRCCLKCCTTSSPRPTRTRTSSSSRF